VSGAPRRRLILSLCPAEHPIIDVGADHGRVAAALGAIATERMPHRRGRARVRWVIADGLATFREVGVAIIAGMGALAIEGILDRGPRPRFAVLHATDDPGHLRRWLAANGWRIDAEGLAPEAGRFAEVLRALPGDEVSTGLELELGPRLLAGADPHLRAHLEQLVGYWQHIADLTAAHAPAKHAAAGDRVRFLTEQLRRRGWG